MSLFQWLVLVLVAGGSYSAVGCVVGGYAAENYLRAHPHEEDDGGLGACAGIIGACAGIIWPCALALAALVLVVRCTVIACEKTFGPAVRVGARLRRARDVPELPEARVYEIDRRRASRGCHVPRCEKPEHHAGNHTQVSS